MPHSDDPHPKAKAKAKTKAKAKANTQANATPQPKAARKPAAKARVKAEPPATEAGPGAETEVAPPRSPAPVIAAGEEPDGDEPGDDLADEVDDELDDRDDDDELDDDDGHDHDDDHDDASRRYRLAEVNELLLGVRRLFDTVMELKAQLRGLRARLEDRGHAPPRKLPPTAPPDVVRDRAVFDALAETLRDHVEEIAATGCVVRDLETGLCDWLGEHDGRDVWLCWRYGEREVGFFHELDTGFAGRRPVSELRESTLRVPS